MILFASLNAAKIAAMSGPTRVLLIDGWAITDGMSITDGMAITDDMSITDGMAIIESMSIPRVSTVPLPSWFIWLLTCGIWLETCGVWFETPWLAKHGRGTMHCMHRRFHHRRNKWRRAQ